MSWSCDLPLVKGHAHEVLDILCVSCHRTVKHGMIHAFNSNIGCDVTILHAVRGLQCGGVLLHSSVGRRVYVNTSGKICTVTNKDIRPTASPVLQHKSQVVRG
jgi:hypothetical protein